MRDRVLLAVISVVAALGLAELTLGVAAPQIHRLPDVWMHDPGLGWRHRPGAEGRLITPEFDVAYRIDAQGRRQHAPVMAGRNAADAAPGSLIELYGDSFAEGWGVDVDEGVAARLEAHLAASHLANRGARVENYGVAGYGTDQELLLFGERGTRRAPDLVICLFYGNDLWNNISRHGIGAQRGGKPYFRPLADGRLVLRGVPVAEPPPRLEGLSHRLAQHLHLWALLARATAPQADVPETSVEQYYGALYTPGAAGAEYRPLWELTEALLGAFSREVAEAGGRFVLVHAPAIVQIEADDWRTKRDLHALAGDYDLDKPSRRLAQICARKAIDLIDLYPDFLAAAAAGADLYYDDSHWTAAGHELAARMLTQALGSTVASPTGADD